MTCTNCDARCCRYFSFEIDKPAVYEDFENLRWYLLHQGVSIHIDEGRWYIAMVAPCKKLGRDNRCTIYADRPLICRTYSSDNCDRTEGPYEYEAEFTEPEQIDAYARKTMGEERHVRAQARSRTQANP